MIKLKVVENEKLKVLTWVRTHPEELLVPKKFIFLDFGQEKVKNGVYDHMTKLKNVWNVILKVLTCVRTHLEELIVPNISF